MTVPFNMQVGMAEHRHSKLRNRSLECLWAEGSQLEWVICASHARWPSRVVHMR